MEQAVTKARARTQRPNTCAGAVKSTDQDLSDPIARLLLGRRVLKLPVRLGKGRRPCGLDVAQVPENASTDHRRQIALFLSSNGTKEHTRLIALHTSIIDIIKGIILFSIIIRRKKRLFLLTVQINICFGNVSIFLMDVLHFFLS